jgi:hypothetical protein
LFGGNRSGKSRSSAQEIFWWFDQSHPYQQTPKSPRIWVLSVEYRTIYEGIWSHLKNVIPDWTIAKIGPKIPGWDIPTYVESKKGARIDFISAIGGDDTRRKLQSAEIDLLSIDEEVGGELWTELQMRLLTRGGRVVVSATLVESEDWLLNLEDEAESGAKENLKETGVSLFRLDTTLNKYNNQELLGRIFKNLSEEEKEVRIYGKRRRSVGLVYNSYNSDIHEIAPFPIPPTWTRVMAFDPGWRIAAALWIAIGPENQKVAYREMYLANVSLGEIVKFIRASEGYIFDADRKIWIESDNFENIDLRLIDPSAFRHLEDGSLGVGYQLSNDFDLNFASGYNDKRTNVEDVRSWLDKRIGPEGQKTPELMVFKTLEYFKKERSKYRLNPDKSKRDKDQATDRPLKKDDHLMNCLEYLASARPYYRPAQTYKDKFKEQISKKAEDVEWPDNRLQKIKLIRERNKLLIDDY